MIITLTKANFSAKNIGMLNAFAVLTNILNATYDGPTSVMKGEAFNATVTMNAGYSVQHFTVSMGGQNLVDSYTINNGVITISIPSVSGVVTINMSAEGTVTNDIVLNLDDYLTYRGCIQGSDGRIIYTGPGTTVGNYFYQIPLTDFTYPSSVTVVAGNTKAYVAIFKQKVTETMDIPPYAMGYSAQTILEPNATQTFELPFDATHMYILATNGSGSSLRPANVVFHGAIANGNSDPVSGGGTSGGGTTTNEYFGTKWTLGSTVSSTGSLAAQPTYAVSPKIARPEGKNLKYTPYTDDQIWLVIGKWNGNEWIERVTFDPAKVTSATTIELGDNVTHIQLGYGRTSSSNIKMDEASLSHLQIEWI